MFTVAADVEVLAHGLGLRPPTVRLSTHRLTKAAFVFPKADPDFRGGLPSRAHAAGHSRTPRSATDVSVA
ncbi:hypothetical protein, partial [Streptomyces sp. NPDC058457]|uniref:hypothetical protein n=1 Tax=Streptomyces sp. NPDC058457 TaxID=3346507 RepID=UPI0036478175